MISVLTKDAKDIEVDKNQACRFMGYHKGAEDTDFDALYDECLKVYVSAANLKAAVRKTEVSFSVGNEIHFDFGIIESESLKKNLQGCKNAYIFAATVGSEVDRLIKRTSAVSKGKGMMLSCIASSGIEGWCDYINEEMAKGKKLRPRYSPGYGDVSLSVQTDILQFLDANRKIGLSLTDTFMMVPTKSVTAIVGILEEE